MPPEIAGGQPAISGDSRVFFRRGDETIMTSTQETLAVARAYGEAINARDWDRLRREVLAPDVEAWSHSAQHLERGPEEIIAALQKTSGAVADTRLEVVNAIAEGD